MFTAETLSTINGAIYKFGSSSFKWVFDQSIHFAKHILHKNPDAIIVRYHFNNGAYVSVMRESITVIYDHKMLHIERECV